MQSDAKGTTSSDSTHSDFNNGKQSLRTWKSRERGNQGAFSSRNQIHKKW